MNITNKDLKKRIIQISFKNKLSHIGSCLTAVDIIDEIYATKKRKDKFVLSSGHAGLALYVVLEKYNAIHYKINDHKDGYSIYSEKFMDAEKIFAHHGVHPDRCKECQIDFSTGSLGQGLPAAVGMALADRTKNVYCLISDGECAEGSIWEAVRIVREQKLNNLNIYLNYNGWAAYKPTDLLLLPFGDTELRETSGDYLPFLKGQDAHYYVMNKEDYALAQNILS